MIKRLFEYLALSLLAVLGLAKLRGKRVNPLALRVLLGILSFLAYRLSSTTVLLFSGTWLLFLLAGDLGRAYGIDLNLFLPAADGEEPGAEMVEYSLDTENTAIAKPDPSAPNIWNRCAQHLKSFNHSERIRK